MTAGYAAYNQIQCGDRDQMVLDHAPLVKKIAYHLLGKLPDSVDVEDLIQAGMMGLLEAASHFRVDGGARFETFAGIRIRGAMIDHLRSTGWVPRSVSRQLRQLSEAIRKVEHRVGREASSAEVAQELGISQEEYFALLKDASTVQVCSIEQVSNEEGEVFGQGSDNEEAFTQLASSDFQSALAGAIECLPEKEKLVLSLYYDRELTMKEIGEVLDVSESRVCQIHGQAVVRLKGRMSDWVSS